MGTVIDLTNVEGGGGFEPIPGGQYHLAVTGVEVKESGPNSKNPGSLYIAWEFTIQAGEYEGRRLWTNTSLLPQALFGLKGLIAAAKIDGLDPNGQLDLEEVVDRMQGAEVVGVVVKQKKPAAYAQFEGEEQNNIKSFKPMSEFKAPGPKGSSLLP